MSSEPTDLTFVDGLVQLSFLVQSVLAKTAARHDLTVPQVRLLGILRDREPGMLQLARHLGLDKSSVTGLIDRAERRGLVKRTSSVEDGRAVRVSSTPLGRRITKQASAEVVIRIHALGDALTAAEQRSLARLVSRILGAYETSTTPASPSTLAGLP
jgi:MarR family transcriptional regulator, lower aerobic nicotinate degradation pathway regulator